MIAAIIGGQPLHERRRYLVKITAQKERIGQKPDDLQSACVRLGPVHHACQSDKVGFDTGNEGENASQLQP